jgi:hypothetical protein
LLDPEPECKTLFQNLSKPARMPAKQSIRKLSQIKLSESAKPHELQASDWFDLVNSGAARCESDTKEARVAVLRLPFVGWVQDGALCVARIGASIKSTWQAWEREWLRTLAAGEWQLQQDESYVDREVRVARERETQLLIEALEWQSTRQKTRKNSIRWVSYEHLREVLAAFGREMPA